MADQSQQRGRRERRSRRRIQREEQEAQRRKRYMIGGAIIGAILLVVIALTVIELVGQDDEEAADDFPEIQVASAMHDNISSEPYFLGDPDAPVHLIEWSDYQWPGCGFFAREAKPQLVEEYVEPGLVYLEYRDFAHIGDETIRAAEGAACAAEQDAYWDYNETLYQNQHTPPVNAGAYSDERLFQIAEELGLDMDAFESCMDDETYRDQIEASTAEAQDTGITSTPQFQVNGRIVEWDGYEDLAAEIEAELE